MAVDQGVDPGQQGSPGPDAVMGAVMAAVTALGGSDPATLSPDALATRVQLVDQALAMLASHQVDCVAVMEARGDARALGFRSTQSWLRSVVRVAPGAAKGLVALARRLGDRAGTATAFAAGRISLPHAQVLARTLEEIAPCLDDPDQVTAIEADLVAVAERTDSLRLSHACRRLRIQAAPERADADGWQAFQQRDLSVALTFRGLGTINGTLDPLGAETVMTAIHAFAAPTGEQDTRTPGQRRADALTEICRRVLTTGQPPTNGGERPHVNVIVPLATIEERVGAQPGELSWTGPISPELVRRILCDAAIHRVIVDGESQPLDIGRATRVVPAGLRRAVMIRDKHCQYPGCDVPAAWCDCHHINPWSRGGPTALHNLILLCGYHHTMIHLNEQTITRLPNGQTKIIDDPDDTHGHRRRKREP